MAKQLDQAYLRSILHYCPDTGVFTWASSRQGILPGRVAGSLAANGYINIGIDRKIYFAHRLAFLWMLGKFPENQVDHINRVKTDNRWSNLRDVPQGGGFGNASNRVIGQKSGLPRGVTKYGRKFRAKIYIAGKHINLGAFSTAKEAGEAYDKAKRERTRNLYPRQAA